MVELIQLNPKLMQPEDIFNRLEDMHFELVRIEKDLYTSDPELSHLFDHLKIAKKSVHFLITNLSVSYQNV